MVKITTWNKQDGTEVNTIKLSGCGDEEEILLTLKMDEVYSKEMPAGISKKTNKEYDAFTIYGIGAIYHKNGQDYDVWVSLTETQAKQIQKNDKLKGLKIIAYKKEKGIGIRLAEEPKKTIQPTLLTTPTNNYKITPFERDLLKACKENNLSLEDAQAQFKGYHEKGDDIIDYNIERIKHFF